MAQRRYSRLAKVEEKKAKRSIFIYSSLTIIFLVIIFLYGIGFLSHFADFINNLAGGDKPIVISDNTPPAPPRVDSFNEFTNKTNVTLSGSAEPGAIVSIIFNKDYVEVVADADGKFSHDFDLLKGDNTFSLYAVDKSGNKSNVTQTYTITYDNEEPKIEITKPEDHQTFYGTSEQNITIEGTSEPNSTLTINDRVIVLSSSGEFKLDTRLEPGDNNFAFKAVDQAGNESELNLTVSFNP
jgi:hypothetical protein